MRSQCDPIHKPSCRKGVTSRGAQCPWTEGPSQEHMELKILAGVLCGFFFMSVSLKEHFWIPDFCSYLWCLWDIKVCYKQKQLSQVDKLQSFFQTPLCQKPINGQNFCPSHLNPTRDSAESILEFSPTQLRVQPESGNVHVEQQASEDCDWKAGEERPKVAKVNDLSSCW